MKKIVLLILLVLLVGCDQTTSSETTLNTTQTTTINQSISITETTYPLREYSEFDSLHILNPNEQLSQQEEHYYIYYYGIYCGACLNIKNEVLSKIELLENDVVYLVSTSNYSDIHEDISVEYTPSLVEIRDGEVVEIFVGATSILNVINTLT